MCFIIIIVHCDQLRCDIIKGANFILIYTILILFAKKSRVGSLCGRGHGAKEGARTYNYYNQSNELPVLEPRVPFQLF